MEYGLVSAAYISASVLFILSLGGLSNQEKAKELFGLESLAWAFPFFLLFLEVIPVIFGYYFQ